jgi:hypothetical protein
MNILPATPDRANFLFVKEWLKNAGANPLDFIISKSDLRLEKLLTANDGVYNMKCRRNTGADRPLENKLAENDLFFVSHMAICITKQDATASPPEYANHPLFTFPDKNFFSVANEARALETIYGGYTEFKTSVTTRIPKILNWNFRYAPEKQVWESGATNNQTADDVPQYGASDSERGFYDLGQLQVLDGLEDNEVIVSLGAGNRVMIAGTSPNLNVLVVLLKGIVVSEGAQKVGRHFKQYPFV